MGWPPGNFLSEWFSGSHSCSWGLLGTCGGADIIHTAKVISTGDEFKETFLETYGKPISSAAEWYDERSPYQDLVSMYWRVDGDMTNSHEVDRIKLMAHLVKQKR